MSLRLIDLEGNHYPAEATTAIDDELNSDSMLSITFHSTRTNDYFISDLSELWRIKGIKGTGDDTEYVITLLSRKGKGNKMFVSVRAIPKLFDDLSKDREYERFDQSFTAQNYFTLVFKDTPYTFVLLDSFSAKRFEGLGEGDQKIKMFSNGINRYGIEYEIIGNEVRMRNRVERDMPYQLRWRLNASNIQEEIDATGFVTYAKGYGDYGDGEGGEDWRNAKLIREYTSPLAQIPGVGIRHAQPIKNGNITNEDTMDDNLKTLVDESLKVSVTSNFHRLKNYPYADPQNGDLIHLIDGRINFNRKVRIIKVTTHRDSKGNIIKQNVTFGDIGIVKRHQSKINATLNTVDRIMDGRQKIPFSVLDDAVLAATKALQNAQTELVFPDVGGIHAVDKTNPNKLVVFNSAGIGISDDGGQTFKTAMTGDGIVADVITAGTLRGIDIIGTNIISFNPDNGNVVTLADGEITTFEDGKQRFGIYGNGLVAYHWETEQPVARFRASHINNESFGAGIIATGDYFTIGRQKSEASGTSLSQLGFYWDEDYDKTILYGGSGKRDSGHLTLRSTHTGGSAGSRVPHLEIDNRTVNGTAYSGARFYVGRDNKSPGSSDFRSGFEVWQYIGDAKDGLNLLFDLDTNTSNKTYIDAWVDEFYIKGHIRADGGLTATEKSHIYADLDMHNWDILNIGNIAVSGFIQSTETYNKIYTGTDQMVRVTDNGILGRSTSSRRYKINEKVIDLDYAKRILELNAVSWYDKRSAEEYCHTLSTGEETEVQRVVRIGGVIAEDTHDSGLEMYVNYDDKNRPDGVSSFMWTLLIPISKDHENRLNEYDDRFGTVENRLDRLENEINKLKGVA